MEVAFYSSDSWESWGLSAKPVIPEGMAFLIDDDLLFQDEHGLRATAAANEWLRLRPTEKCPAPLMALAAFAAVGSPAARYRQLLACKYGILGRLTLFGSRLRRGLDGTVGIRVTL
ncbi:hypothetical protein [Streptomyces mirabilis]|uniref:hypothetical protein n=1 Tax=Streptomyces mirabilis TaxID=68239 RepID=UPI003330013B